MITNIFFQDGPTNDIGTGISDSVPENVNMGMNSAKEMREFFELLAASLGFDPSVDDNWYANFEAVKNIVLHDKVILLFIY